MSTSIFKKLHSTASPSRNAFDLSYHSNYTNRVGLLTPCFVKEVNPNEKFSIDVNSFVRTQPLNTAAFARIKHNIDFFFVPYRAIYHNFGNFYTRTRFNSRSWTNYGDDTQVPLISRESWKRMFDTYYKGVSASTDNLPVFSDSKLCDIHGYSILSGAPRLLDMLGYGYIDFYSLRNNCTIFDDVNASIGDDDTKHGDHWIGMSFPNVNLNPLRLCAYQKVYQDFYRNSLYEVLDCETYSLDGYTDEDRIPESMLLKLITQRYINFKPDKYTITRPSFAGANFIGYQSIQMDDVGTSRNTTPQLDFSDKSSSNYGQAFFDVPSTLDVNTIRAAFALDKLGKLMERSEDGSYSAQIKARFGVAPREDGDSSIFIGSYDDNVIINEVVSTADTQSTDFETGEALGRISGRGLSSGNGHIEFESSEHGVIIGIEYFLPETDYSSYGVDYFNTCTRPSDYYCPEFDNLGYLPYYSQNIFANSKAYDMNVYNGSPSEHTTWDSVKAFANNYLLGYNLPFIDYKTSVDEVHGEFRTNRSLSAWSACRNLSPKDFKNGLPKSFFKVDPAYLDNIFTVTAAYKNSEKNDDGVYIYPQPKQLFGLKDIGRLTYKFDLLSQAYDHFLCSTQFNVTALRPMSVYGLPNV